MAVGGDWAGAMGIDESPNIWEFQLMTIDYVRIWGQNKKTLFQSTLIYIINYVKLFAKYMP